MTCKTSGFKGFLAPIWQEVSSLWSGAEFAFLDQSSYGDGDDAPSPAFYEMAEAPQYSHC